MKLQQLGGIRLIAMLAGFASGAAQASAEFNYFEEYAYDEPMMRCVDALRPALPLSATDKVAYVIEDIDLTGPWYRFEIRTTVTDADGKAQLEDLRVTCKTNRWIDSTWLVELPGQGEPVLESAELLSRR